MHVSVMLEEAITALDINPNGIYVDATLGRAGHSQSIVKNLTQGKLIGIDKDLEALEASKKILGESAILVHDSFSNIDEILKSLEIDKINGILFDLGVSSPQFDQQERGFSYRFDAKLDMRMDQTQNLSAYEVVNEYDEGKLIDILKTYSDERYAKGIVRNIVDRRPINTTFELVDCIRDAYPYHARKKGHPAKKTFQAIRMEVNNELKDIEKGLREAIDHLDVGGRIVVITFHSVEDRLVKQIFNEYATPRKVDPRIPVPLEEEKLNFKWIHKVLKPSKEEIELNNRAHSAILRCIERTDEDGKNC